MITGTSPELLSQHPGHACTRGAGAFPVTLGGVYGFGLTSSSPMTGQVWHLPGLETITGREILDTSTYSSNLGLTTPPLAMAVDDTLGRDQQCRPACVQTELT